MSDGVEKGRECETVGRAGAGFAGAYPSRVTITDKRTRWKGWYDDQVISRVTCL